MSLFSSKKFWMAIAGIVAMIVSHFLGIGEEQVMGILSLIITYILGQGLADFGKEAKKVGDGK